MSQEDSNGRWGFGGFEGDRNLTSERSLHELVRRLVAVEKRLDRIDPPREADEHFLAPPLPWWARSPRIG